MKTELTSFIKTYALNILLIIGFIGIFILTQFIHNIHVYKWLLIEYFTEIELSGEINTNNKYFLQDFIFSIVLLAGSILVDYFRSLFYSEDILSRVFVACITVFIVFFINWTIFELFGSLDHNSLYYNPTPRHSSSYSANVLLIIDMVILIISIVGVFLLEKSPIVQQFNNYIKNIILKFGDTNQE